jgi:peptidoglycan/LPS O-acetylase OafA/YrhL
MGERNHTIDLLRFLACTWVFLFHMNDPLMFTYFSYDERWMSAGDGYRNFTNLGGLGVSVFFVVSGYCMGLAAQHSKGPFDFLCRRIFRIFPGYWFSLLIVIAAVVFHILFLGQNSVTVLPKSITEITTTLLLLTKPFSSTETVNWVYWSLTVEIFFYLIIGMSLFFKPVIRQWLVLLVSAAAFIPQAENVPGLFFLSNWSIFAMGLGLYELHSKKKYQYYGLAILLVNIINLIYHHRFDSYFITTVVTLFAIAISVYWRDLPANPFSRLGDFAYGVYLLHVPIGVYMFGVLKTIAIKTTPIYSFPFDLGVFCVIMVLAAAIYKYLELPGIGLGKKLSRKINAKPTLLSTIRI